MCPKIAVSDLYCDSNGSLFVRGTYPEAHGLYPDVFESPTGQKVAEEVAAEVDRQIIDGYCGSTPANERILAQDVAPVGPKMCVNVASDDTLNLRAGPGTRHRVVGALASGNCLVELFDICEGNWCQVRWGHVSGWTNTRYLGAPN